MQLWRAALRLTHSTLYVKPARQRNRSNCDNRWPVRQKPCAARQRAMAAHALSKSEAYRLLGADQGCSRSELRSAYMERIRQVAPISESDSPSDKSLARLSSQIPRLQSVMLHPDVNPLKDTTEDAVALNEAYALLQQAFLNGEEEDIPSIFDVPEAEPSELFINPFACNTTPLMWRELQEVARGTDDPVGALAAQGVYIRDSAVSYLTPCQLAAIIADLEAMEDSLALELTSWLVSDCLMRAVRANERSPAQR